MSEPSEPIPILIKVPVCPKCSKKLADTESRVIHCPHCGREFFQRDIRYIYVWTENHAS